MKNVLSLFLISFILFSCSKENAIDSSTNNDRLSFKTQQEFQNTFALLDKMSSQDELSAWSQSKNHSTLLNSSDSTIEDYSNSLKTILNKDSEFELGDSIIWFNNGTFYAIGKSEEATISTLKKDIRNLHVVGSVKISKIQEPILKSGSIGTDVNFNNTESHNQKEFYEVSYQENDYVSATPHTGHRKFVHQLFDQSIKINEYTTSQVISSTLYLRLKLEWKGSGNWKAASEARDISINVSGYFYLSVANSIAYSINLNNHRVSGNCDYYIGGATRVAEDNFSCWRVGMEGSITQQICGDVTANKWVNSYSGTNPLSPLW